MTVKQRQFLKEVIVELNKRTEGGEQNLKIRYYNSIPKIAKVKDQETEKKLKVVEVVEVTFWYGNVESIVNKINE